MLDVFLNDYIPDLLSPKRQALNLTPLYAQYLVQQWEQSDQEGSLQILNIVPSTSLIRSANLS